MEKMMMDEDKNLVTIVEKDGKNVKVRYVGGQEAWVQGDTISPVTLDGVDSPNHYELMGGEVIDLIKDRLPKDAYMGFLEGNVIKYVMRWRHKNGVEDLKKAKKYLSWMIEEKE